MFQGKHDYLVHRATHSSIVSFVSLSTCSRRSSPSTAFINRENVSLLPSEIKQKKSYFHHFTIKSINIKFNMSRTNLLNVLDLNFKKSDSLFETTLLMK